jgi:hypothetical protein
MLRVADCITDRIRLVIPQPTKWQRIGNQIDAAFVFARADFVNAHGYGKHFIVRADELLTAFLELERAIHEFAVSLISYWPRRNVCADEKLTAFVELESAIRHCAELACQVGEIFGK